MKISDRALAGVIAGLIAIATVFTAIMFRPSLIQLGLFTAALCGAGHFSQLMIRWAWRRVGSKYAMSGAAFGLALAFFALVRLDEGAPAVLDWLDTPVLLIVLAIHIRSSKRSRGTRIGTVRIVRRV